MAFAALDLGKLEQAAARILSDGDPTNARRSDLAIELGRKGAAERYAALGIRAEVVSFIDDMARAYASATIVIGRAGATALALSLVLISGTVSNPAAPTAGLSYSRHQAGH